MTTLRLVLEPRSLEVGPHGAVTGQIFFKVNSVAFPDDAWNDFALVILSWWSEALAALRGGAGTETELIFMDGPYALRLRRQSDGDCAAEFVERSRDRVVGRTTAKLPALLQDVADAASVVLSFCEGRTVPAADVDALREARNRIAPS